nr:hypothetical protein [Azoarcus sp. DN11]
MHALHAAVHAFLDRTDRIFPCPILREGRGDAHPGHRVGLGRVVLVAGRAGEVVAGKAHLAILHFRPDDRESAGREFVAVAHEIAIGVVRQLVERGGRTVDQADFLGFLGKCRRCSQQ